VISNAGSGTLLWSAEAANPNLITVAPAAPSASSSARLLVSFAPGFVQPDGALVETTLRVIDVGGATPDEQVITVLVGAVVGGPDCGDADASGDGTTAHVTATDALQALRAAVGIGACELCRCDVDGSQTITASDALTILKSAVGQQVERVCAVC
jgi:hypothetical protein